MALMKGDMGGAATVVGDLWHQQTPTAGERGGCDTTL